MGVEQKTIITGKTESGEEVRFQDDTEVSLIRVTTLEGKEVLVVPDSRESQEVRIHVEFDDIMENNVRKTMDWTGGEIPDDAWRTVTVAFFDGTRAVFSHPREAIRFLKQLPPLRSPKEQEAKVLNIAEYVPDNGNQ